MPLHRIPFADGPDALAATVDRLERQGHQITYIGDTSLEWVVLTAPPRNPFDPYWRAPVEERAA